jgi:hypothetical protein
VTTTTERRAPGTGSWPPGVSARYITAHGMRFLDRGAHVEVTGSSARCTACPAVSPPSTLAHPWAQEHAHQCTAEPRS